MPKSAKPPIKKTDGVTKSIKPKVVTSSTKPPKPAPKPVSKPVDQPEPQPTTTSVSGIARRPGWPRWVRVGGGVVMGALLLVGSFEIAYAGKIFPGVTADGVYLGGQSRDAARRHVAEQTENFSGQPLTISHDGTNLRIPVERLHLTYDTALVSDLAFRYGREGSLFTRAHQQLRALFGRATNFSAYHYDDAALVPYLTELYDDIVTPVQNAYISYSSGGASIKPAEPGARLDLGRLTQLVNDRLSQASTDPIVAPVYQVKPTLETAPLEAKAAQLDKYLAGPITIKIGDDGDPKIVDHDTIISWIQVAATSPRPFLQSQKLEDLFPGAVTANIGVSQAAIAAYVAAIAKSTDQTAQNAMLAMQNGQLIVTRASKTGIKLDQTTAIKDIEGSLTKSADDRTVNLGFKTAEAAVNENNLSTLGITELISQGETYFPGSPSTRLTNVRAGAAKFNGVLLAPGEVFSFGKLLGDVGPATGYVPELVILGDHEEKQYGGGLCQVSSTAFRAALAAGLPINERVNHSFAISYYTWPYSAPGVDATIYYPAVDFKFTNDTGHYILMQTTMSGNDLKFDYYGTKTKSGTIRGPQFVSGNSDATKPSHTVFYRDVLDLTGNVTKTDTFHTYYKSSKDFPITQQFN